MVGEAELRFCMPRDVVENSIPTALSLDSQLDDETISARFAEFATEWRTKYPAMIGMWERAWPEFVPFLDYPPELRRLIYTTNGIESLNVRFRQAVRRRGNFPNEQAAMKILYLTVAERRKNRANPTGRINGWKFILNTLAIVYGDRLNLS